MTLASEASYTVSGIKVNVCSRERSERYPFGCQIEYYSGERSEQYSV